MTSDKVTVGQVRDAIAAAVPKLRERLGTHVAEMKAKYADKMDGDAVETLVRGAVEVGVGVFAANMESQLADLAKR